MPPTILSHLVARSSSYIEKKSHFEFGMNSWSYGVVLIPSHNSHSGGHDHRPQPGRPHTPRRPHMPRRPHTPRPLRLSAHGSRGRRRDQTHARGTSGCVFPMHTYNRGELVQPAPSARGTLPSAGQGVNLIQSPLHVSHARVLGPGRTARGNASP